MIKNRTKRQQSALARKRKYYLTHHVPAWTQSHPGGWMYERILATKGKEEADLRAAAYERHLVRAAKEAQVNRYGIPLEVCEQYQKDHPAQ